MARHLLLSLAVALGLSLPAMAQPTGAAPPLMHPGGWSITPPAGIRPGANPIKGGSLTVLVVRGNVAAGACVTTINTQPKALTAAVWDRTVDSFMSNAEAEGRLAAERSGHTFLRHLGSAPVLSSAGWRGFSLWYERTNKTSGNLQSAYLASSMLSPTQRLMIACSSATGYVFEAADYARFKELVASVRLN